MSEAKRLLAEATPLPWHSTILPKTTTDEYGKPIERIPSVYGRPRDEHYIVNIGRGYPGARLDGIRAKTDAALIVYAVNHLPAYEEAVRLLDLLVDAATRYHVHGETKAVITIGAVAEKVPAVLRRLREDPA